MLVVVSGGWFLAEVCCSEKSSKHRQNVADFLSISRFFEREMDGNGFFSLERLTCPTFWKAGHFQQLPDQSSWANKLARGRSTIPGPSTMVSPWDFLTFFCGTSPRFITINIGSTKVFFYAKCPKHLSVPKKKTWRFLLEDFAKRIQF